MIKKAIGKLAIILSPLVAWLGVGFLLYPSHLLKLATELEEEIDMQSIRMACRGIAIPCLILSVLFLVYWLGSRWRLE